jgi:hypothetical protein
MDWVGAALNLLGLWLLADHRRYAARVFLLSSVVFLVWSITDQVWSIAALQSVLIVLNVRVIIKWRNNDQ